jgi:hypothetical protein
MVRDQSGRRPCQSHVNGDGLSDSPMRFTLGSERPLRQGSRGDLWITA